MVLSSPLLGGYRCMFWMSIMTMRVVRVKWLSSKSTTVQSLTIIKISWLLWWTELPIIIRFHQSHQLWDALQIEVRQVKWNLIVIQTMTLTVTLTFGAWRCHTPYIVIPWAHQTSASCNTPLDHGYIESVNYCFLLVVSPSSFGDRSFPSRWPWLTGCLRQFFLCWFFGEDWLWCTRLSHRYFCTKKFKGPKFPLFLIPLVKMLLLWRWTKLPDRFLFASKRRQNFSTTGIWRITIYGIQFLYLDSISQGLPSGPSLPTAQRLHFHPNEGVKNTGSRIKHLFGSEQSLGNHFYLGRRRYIFQIFSPTKLATVQK